LVSVYVHNLGKQWRIQILSPCDLWRKLDFRIPAPIFYYDTKSKLPANLDVFNDQLY
jgi:hypothetical protein